ncbi:MAG: MASE3 domain-containing protein [Candidatus Thiodiazotropha sp.]
MGPINLAILTTLILVSVASLSVSYLLFHTLSELFAITVGFMIGVVGGYTFRFSHNHMLAFLAAAYPFIALIDLLHSLAYKGMGIFPPDADLPTQLWIAARGLEAAALLMAPAYLRRPVHPVRAVSGFALVTAILLGLIAGGLFPEMYRPDTGLTPLKIGTEYLIILLLGAAAIRLWRLRRHMDPQVLKLMGMALALTMLSELLFTFYIGVYDLSNMLGHLAKLASFWLVFVALVQTGLVEPLHLLNRSSTTYDAIPDEICVVDAEGRIRQVNRVIEQNYSDVRLGDSVHARFHPRIAPAECPACAAILERTAVNTLDLHYPEEGRWRELTLSPIADKQTTHGTVHVLRDVTLRKQAEEEFVRLNRVLRAITASNQTLIHARDEEDLLHDVCDIVVEKGGYRMAWVGYPGETPGRPIIPKAWAGLEAGYLSETKFSWSGNSQNMRPAVQAIRTGSICVSNDIANDPAFEETREPTLGRGFAATAAFPLHDSAHHPIGTLTIYSDKANVFSAEEVEILSELAGDLGYGINALRAGAARDAAEANAREWQRQLAGTLEQTVQAVAGMVELRDPYTAGHQRRVAELAVAIGREMGLDERRLEGLLVTGLVHDIGKIQVPSEIISRPCKLSDLEFNLIKVHSYAGYDILKEIPFPWPVADTVHQHHERLDGSGYPRGLTGDEILLEARIISVADVVEAMASYRPYREAIPLDQVMAEIEHQAGTLYDPEVVNACLRLFREQGFVWGQPTIVEHQRDSAQPPQTYH